jgi:hypothetical protein
MPIYGTTKLYGADGATASFPAKFVNQDVLDSTFKEDEELNECDYETEVAAAEAGVEGQHDGSPVAAAADTGVDESTLTHLKGVSPVTPPGDGLVSSVDDSTIGGGGCAAEALVYLDAYTDVATAKQVLNELGGQELAHRKTQNADYSYVDKVYVKDERWCSDVVTKALQKTGRILKKFKGGELESQPRGRTLRSMFGGNTLLVDGTKNQEYLVSGKRKIDDREDPSPDQDPALWRHLAIVKEGQLYDAYHPNGLSLNHCKLGGVDGYFKEIIKCYDVQKQRKRGQSARCETGVTDDVTKVESKVKRGYVAARTRGSRGGGKKRRKQLQKEKKRDMAVVAEP